GAGGTRHPGQLGLPRRWKGAPDVCGIVAALPAYQSLASEDAASMLPVLPGPPLAAAQLLRQPAAAEKALRDLLGEAEAALQALSTETAGVELLRDGPARQELATACSA